MKKRLVCLVFALSMIVCATSASFVGSRTTGFVDRIEDNDVAIVEIVLPDGSFYYVDVVSELLTEPLEEGEVIGFYRIGKAYWYANKTRDRGDDFQILNIGPDGTYASWPMVIDYSPWYDDREIVYVDRLDDEGTAVLEIIADDGYVYMVKASCAMFPEPLKAGDKLEVFKYDGSYWFTCGTVAIDDDVEVLGKGENGMYTSWPGAINWSPASWFEDFLATRH